MGKASRQLDSDRAARRSARRRFDSRLEQVKQDLTVGAMTSRFKRRARNTVDEAIEITVGNRAVVAGTVAALGLWFLRKPILAWIAARLNDRVQAKDIVDDDE